MKLKSVIAAAAIAVMVPLIAAPAQAAERELTAKVKAALADSSLRQQHIRVASTGNHTVALSGTVKNMTQVRQAMDTAQAVDRSAVVTGSFDVEHLPPATPIR